MKMNLGKHQSVSEPQFPQVERRTPITNPTAASKEAAMSPKATRAVPPVSLEQHSHSHRTACEKGHIL